MGSKFSKWRNKTTEKYSKKPNGINTRSSAGFSTQSLDNIGRVSVSTNPNPSVYSKPENYSVYSKPDVTQTLSRTQSEGDITVEVHRRKTQRDQQPTIPIIRLQKKNSQDVTSSETPPQLKPRKSGYPDPSHSVYSQPEATPGPTWVQNEELIATGKQRLQAEQTQKIAAPVQKDISKRVTFIETAPQLKPNTEKGESRVYLSPNLKFKPEVKATVSYTAVNVGDLSFIKGDIMQIINDEERDGWFLVKDFATGNVGRVLSKCVEKITNVDVESQKFFWDLNKSEAEVKLMEPDIEFGTYLIRRSADTCSHALSLRCETEFYELEISHYKLVVDEKGVCYIDADANIKPFSSIIELIRYYTDEPGLRCKLKTPLFHGISIDDLAVRFSDLKLGEELGSGNFGFVRAGTLHGDREVAVKSLNAGSSMNVQQFRKEAETMHKLRHPCLVSLLAICEDNGKMYIITEKMARGALRTLLRNNGHHTIKLSDLMEMASQVAEGMCYLEMKGFVHRDLRAANVLAGDGNIVKIADFGMARLLDYYYGEEDYYRSKKGSVFPYKWTAPEAIKKQWFTVKSDVWSFGILLYEIVTYGDEPYAAMSNFEALRWVEMGNRLEKPVDYNCPLALYNVMRQCWLKNSDERPDFAYIKENLIEIKMNA